MPGLDANTKLLMHMDGADAGTTFGDSSTANPKGNATVTADVNTRTATKKFGTASAEFDGNSGILTYADDADWEVSADDTQDYTIDFWVKHDDHAGQEHYIGQFEDNNNYWHIYHENNVGFQFRIISGGAPAVDLPFSSEIKDTDFHHIALCKVTSGGPTVEWGLYRDGVQTGYVSDNTESTRAGTLRIGALNSSQYFDGYIDELRIQQSNYFEAAPADSSAGITQDLTSSIRLLGDWAGTEYRVAQSFTVPAGGKCIDKVMIDVDTIGGGSPTTNCTVRIETDSAGDPSGTLAHAKLTKAGTLAENTFVTWDFDTNAFVAAGTYWLVMTIADSSNEVWQIHNRAPSAYGGGTLSHSADGGSSWTAVAGEDLAFRVFWFTDTITVPTEAYEAEATNSPMMFGTNF